MKKIIQKDSSPSFLLALTSLADMLPDGEYSVEVIKQNPKRSNPQNAYLWGVVYPHLLKAMQEQGWEVTDTEQMHALCKERFSQCLTINRHTGDILTLPRDTHSMSTAEFTTYVESIRTWCAEYLGYSIPDPIF